MWHLNCTGYHVFPWSDYCVIFGTESIGTLADSLCSHLRLHGAELILQGWLTDQLFPCCVTDTSVLCSTE